MIRKTFLALLFAALMPAVRSQETGGAPGAKDDCDLFHPVPETQLRELSPDRPDKTESPYTVDAGHFQLEMDFANYTYDQTAGTTTRTWNAAPFNFKAGLLDNLDVQLVFDNYQYVHEENGSGKSTTRSGVGDLTTRLKINLWGNDGGRTAFALLPFVKFPTSSDGLGNNAIEGGAIFPLAVELPGGFDLGCETGVNLGQDTGNNRYHEDFINSITASHDLFGNLNGYVEFYSEISTAPHTGWVGTVDAGLGYSLTKNTSLDCGCNFGVTPEAADYNPFAGITMRF